MLACSSLIVGALLFWEVYGDSVPLSILFCRDAIIIMMMTLSFYGINWNTEIHCMQAG